MRLSFLSIAVFLLLPAFGVSATWYVPGHFLMIQDALDSPLVKDGDTIVVKPGTYYENLVFPVKAVTLISEQGPDLTVIDGSDAGAVVEFTGGGNDTVLEGFTLTNGIGYTPGPPYTLFFGGAIYCPIGSPTITQNVITYNRALYGGGIFCESGSPVITGNTITKNSAQDVDVGDGGAIYCSVNSSPVVKDNEITYNSAAGGGGGIYINQSQALIEDNVIAFNDTQFDPGGGIYCRDCDPIIADNAIHDNEADNVGGGLYFWDSSPLLSGNEICRNTASEGGGATFKESSPLIENNVFHDNFTGSRGGGIDFRDSTATMVNNTLTGNSAGWWGGGIRVYEGSEVTVVNTIFWNNTALHDGDEIYIGSSYTPSSVDISYSDVDGGQLSVFVDSGCTLNWGSGMMDADPLFVDEAGGDLHIRYDSPCRNAADDSTPSLPAYDFEGDPRKAHGAVDMGADEFYDHLYVTGDAAPGGAVEVKIVGKAGTSPLFLFVGSGVIDPPLSTKHGDWHLAFPVLVLTLPGSIPPEGIYVLPVDIPSDCPECEIPMQAGVKDKLTNLFILHIE